MSVKLIGEDLRSGDLIVVNSARVSFAKAHDVFDYERDPKLIDYLARNNHWSPFGHAQIVFFMTLQQEQMDGFVYRSLAGMRISQLSNKPYDHKHLVSGSIYAFIKNLDLFNRGQKRMILTSIQRRYPASFAALYTGEFDPSETSQFGMVLQEHDLVDLQLSEGEDVSRHATSTLHIEAPIYVARQLVKHQVDLVWNEVSRRYVDAAPTFAPHPEWSNRPDDKKQGAGGAVSTDTYTFASDAYNHTNAVSQSQYQKLLSYGVAPEQARSVLTLASNTEWYWTGTLDAFARVCHLRLAKDAQKETQLVAEGIELALWQDWGQVWGEAFSRAG